MQFYRMVQIPESDKSAKKQKQQQQQHNKQQQQKKITKTSKTLAFFN